MFKLKKTVLFSHVANEWLEMKKIKIKYSTFVKYNNLITNHLLYYFNQYDISKINSVIISQFFQIKQQENLSVSTLKTLFYILKSITDYANEKYNLTIVLNNVELPMSHQNIKVLDKNDKQLLEEYCFHHDCTLSLAILLSLYGGLRIGEICALQCRDIDLEKGIIFITQTVQRIKSLHLNEKKTELIIGSPKTQTSNRIVPIPHFLCLYIKEHYQLYLHNTYLLSFKQKPMDPRCIQKQFKKLCQQLNIDINFHILRHTYATYCVQKGVDIKSLSEIMGHSSTNITLNLYVHSSNEFKIHQIQKIDRVLSS